MASIAGPSGLRCSGHHSSVETIIFVSVSVFSIDISIVASIGMCVNVEVGLVL